MSDGVREAREHPTVSSARLVIARAPLYKDSDPMDFNACMYLTTAASTSSNAAWPARIPSSTYHLRTLERFAENIIPRFR